MTMILATAILAGSVGAGLVREAVPDSPARVELAGRASWYATPGLTGAAGPSLRRTLGPRWRGKVILVCGRRGCVRVRLTDWCQCYRGTPTERIIDLSRSAFRRVAPLSAGLARVRVRP